MLYAVEVSAADHRATGAPPAQTRILQEAHHSKVIAVAYPRDTSEVFATAACDGTVRVWDVNSYSVISTGRCQVRITGEPLCLDFTGEVSFSGWGDGRIRAHEAESGEELWSIDECHRGGCTAIAVSNNRKFLVSGGEVRVWEIRTREMVANLKQHTGPVTSLKLFPDDSHVYSSSRDRTILQWDLRAETRKCSMTQRMGGVNCIDVLPDNISLVSVGQEKRVSEWDCRESSPLSSFVPPPDAPPMGEQMCIAVCVPPAAQGNAKFALFATGGSGDSRVRLWKLHGANGPSLLSMGDGHSSTVRSLKFSPDGKQLVSVGDDSAVFVWNIFVEEIFPELGGGAPA